LAPCAKMNELAVAPHFLRNQTHLTFAKDPSYSNPSCRLVIEQILRAPALYVLTWSR
jgi:hypothetical protein